jgi:hypothetical protein
MAAPPLARPEGKDFNWGEYSVKKDEARQPMGGRFTLIPAISSQLFHP